MTLHHTHVCHLILWIAIFGHHQLLVRVAIAIMFYFLMILRIFYGLFPVANKSQVHSMFLSFRAHIKTQFEREIKCFQCDNGREYDNQSFYKFYNLVGMTFRFSCPHTSSQNGKDERKICTINNIIRTLLAHASLTPSFWHHIGNLSPQHTSK